MARNLAPAIELIRAFEGIADGDPSTVNLDPYLCPAGVWTIGWGHVVTDSAGRPLKGAHRAARARAIYDGGITMDEAEALLWDDVRKFVVDLDRLLGDEGSTLSDNRYCALLSLIYNIGPTQFEQSTLLRYLRRGRWAEVPAQIERWNIAANKVSDGLRRRRAAEVKLWETEAITA